VILRRLVVAALAAAAGCALGGCDSGPPVTQTRPITTFTRLEVSGDLELQVRLFNRPDPGVRITAGEKAIDRIRTELDNGTLKISTKSRGLTIGPDPLGPVTISLGVPALVGLRVEGRADVDLGGLSARSFELRIDGSGEIRARGASTTSSSRSTARPTACSPTSPRRTPRCARTGRATRRSASPARSTS
jgi:hypothetical protein